MTLIRPAPWRLVLLILIFAVMPVEGQVVRKRVVMPRTLEAALSQPRVRVQLRDGHCILEGRPVGSSLGLEGLLPQEGPSLWFEAYLDTGASSLVVSAATAQQFTIQSEPGAVYHEVGLHGPNPMQVSRRYTLFVVGSPKGAGLPVRLQINPRSPHGLMALMGEINVVGMPVIQDYLVEIDPFATAGADQMKMLKQLEKDLNLGVDLSMLAMDQSMLGGGTMARLHCAEQRVEGYSYAVPLQMRDFNRYQNPIDRGPKPTVAANPMVQNVRSETHHGSYIGAWLLDTGAGASIISKRHAKELGLIDDRGQWTRPQDFTLPIGGISGQTKNPPGFTLRRLIVPAVGVDLEFRDVAVLVYDVRIEMDDGTEVVLDGILGMNLLLPSVSGLSKGLPTVGSEPPFRRVWIDGPRSYLLLEAMPATVSR